MVNQGIITPETRPREWVNSLTYPEKPYGTFHMSRPPGPQQSDPVKILKAPYPQCNLSQVTQSKNLLKINAMNSFWAIHLDKPSSLHTMFNTNTGRYRFLRIPFSLTMMQDIL